MTPRWILPVAAALTLGASVSAHAAAIQITMENLVVSPAEASAKIGTDTAGSGHASNKCNGAAQAHRAHRTAHVPAFLHYQDPKLTLIGGAPQQLSPRGTRWLLEMTVARLPLGSEFSGIAAYGADSVLLADQLCTSLQSCMLS